MDEFHKLNPELKNGTVSTIVTYCTIGYRSVLKAQKLRELYRIPSDKIRNLDGIVPYTHACLHSHDGGNALLINPKTNESTIIFGQDNAGCWSSWQQSDQLLN